MLSKFYNLSMLFERPADLPSIWCVHVLDFDVISQGDNLQHALAMGLEAAMLVVQWDAEAGKDALDRRAPAELWDEFRNIVLHGQPMDGFAQVDELHLKAVAVQAMCVFQVDSAQPVRHSSKPAASRKATERMATRTLQRQPLAWPVEATL